VCGEGLQCANWQEGEELYRLLDSRSKSARVEDRVEVWMTDSNAYDGAGVPGKYPLTVENIGTAYVSLLL
jgi:hypothetical protein